MDQILSEIRLHFTDQQLNDQLKRLVCDDTDYPRHFTQSEDFFIRLPSTYRVPHLAIHHDFSKSKPENDYLEKIRDVVRQLGAIAPSVFADLTYLFDPAEILRPGFFHLYRIGDRTYLYLLRIDLHFRPHAQTLLDKGSNDTTPEYETDQLYIEADFIPLEQVMVEEGKIRAFRIRQSVSQTWIGETGRGYFVQGIWLDRELTKFFSKLFLPVGARTYPYYPYTCKYRAICHSVLDVRPEQRKKGLPMHHRVCEFLAPHMGEIQEALRTEEFSEQLDTFKKLKLIVPNEWQAAWNGLKLSAYLNDYEMKEFKVDHR